MNEFTKHDCRMLVAARYGVHPDTVLEPVPVILMSADLADLQSNGVPANTVYFGDFVIQSYDSSSLEFSTEVNSAGSIFMKSSEGLLPIGNNLSCVIFDNVANFSNINAHFYGWKFTLQP